MLQRNPMKRFHHHFRFQMMFSVWSFQLTSSCYAWCARSFSYASLSSNRLVQRNMLCGSHTLPITSGYHRRRTDAYSWAGSKNKTPPFSASYLSSSSSTSNDTSESPTPETYRKYLATCIPGLAIFLAQELEQLGAVEVITSGTSAVQFQATLETALNILLWVRTAHKILEFLAATDDHEPVSTPKDLYQFIQSNINVKDLLGDGKGGLLTLAVSVQFNNPQYIPEELNHSHFSALTIKNALVDRVRDLRGDGTRPDVEIENPQLPLVAVLRGIRPDAMALTPFHSNAAKATRSSYQPSPRAAAAAHVSLYRCLHPPISLHKRGYRSGQAIHKAALKESLAAGLLLCAGWDKLCQTVATTRPATNTDSNVDSADVTDKSPTCYSLIDPMAGSGSLVVEAAMIAADLAPGLVRIKSKVQGFINPPILQWKYPTSATAGVPLKDIWKALLRDATLRAQQGIERLQQDDAIQIHANDIHSGALDLLQQSLLQAGLDGVVYVHSGDCRNLDIHKIRSKTTKNGSSEFPPASNIKSSTMVVTNPPWGIRLEDDHIESWDSLRIFLRDVCLPDQTEAWILSGNKDATRHLALKKSKSVCLQTGDHDLRWIQYYIGSRETTESRASQAARQVVSYTETDTSRQGERRVKSLNKRAPPVVRSKGATGTKYFGQRKEFAAKPRLKRRAIPKTNQEGLRVDTWFID